MGDIVELSNVTEPYQPILTEEKKYHLFFSHSSEDERDIIPILELLEAPPYNLECCIARRDFMLGEPLTSNMNYALNHSIGTVVFLTPNFLQSGYCKHEVETAFAMYMEGEGRVIPVILKPCTVPNEFRTIHYIDEAIPERIAERIYTCLTTGQTRINGNRFTLTVSDILDRNENEDSTQDEFITHQQKREFERLGIKVDDVLTAILKILVYLHVHKPYYRKHLKKFLILSPILKWFVLLSIMAVISSTMSRWIFNGDGTFSFCVIWAAADLPAAIFLTACVPLPVIYRYVDILCSKKALGKLNQYSLMDKDCCFGLRVSMFSTPVLSVVKYDLNDCKTYLARKYDGLQEDRNTTFDNIWTGLTNSKLYSQYFQRLCNETLPHMVEERHLVLNEKVCLCQYLEIHSCNIANMQPLSSSDVVVVQDSLPLVQDNIDNAM